MTLPSYSVQAWSPRQRRILVGLAGLSALVRLILLFSIPATGKYLVAGIPFVAAHPSTGVFAYLDRRTDYIWFTEDEHCYDEMARAALRGEGFALDNGWMVAPPKKPSSYGGFTYPALVTMVYYLTGGPHQIPVYLIQILLAALSVVSVGQLGKRLFGGDAGILAAGLFGLSPFVVWSSVAMMTEAVFLPLMCLAIWMLVEAIDNDSIELWIAAAIFSALACLSRSALLYFLPIALLPWLFLRKSAVSLAARCRGPVIFSCVFACTIAPWTVRNYQVHHRFLLLDSKAGASLWQYNNPNMIAEIGLRSAMGEPPVPVMPGLTVTNGGNEVDQDQAYKQLTRDYVLQQPGHFLSVLFCRGIIAISPLPLTNASTQNILIGLVWKGSVLLLAILGWILLRPRWRTGAGVVLGLPIYWWLLQVLSGPGQRYRLPVDFAYAILAAGGLVWLAEKRRVRQR
jgi:4-amino-4-deoxy-L-arabinose transferase-like glycosyltransferase